HPRYPARDGGAERLVLSPKRLLEIGFFVRHDEDVEDEPEQRAVDDAAPIAHQHRSFGRKRFVLCHALTRAARRVPAYSSKCSSLQGMLPFIRETVRLGLRPIALYGESAAARMAACQPLNFCFRVSPTSSYSRAMSPSLLPMRSPYGRLVTRIPVAAGGSASWKRPVLKVMYLSTRA